MGGRREQVTLQRAGGREREMNWVLKRRRPPNGEARKDMPSKGNFLCKGVALGKGMIYSEKGGPTGLYYLIDTF